MSDTAFDYYNRDPKKMGRRRKMKLYEQLAYNDIVEVHFMQKDAQLKQTNGVISEKFQDPATKGLFFCVIEHDGEGRAITFELSEIWSLKIIHDWQDLISSDDDSITGQGNSDKSGHNASTEVQIGSQSTPTAEFQQNRILSPARLSPIPMKQNQTQHEFQPVQSQPRAEGLRRLNNGAERSEENTPFFTARDSLSESKQNSRQSDQTLDRTSPILATQDLFLRSQQSHSMPMAELYNEDLCRAPLQISKSRLTQLPEKRIPEDDIVELIDNALSSQLSKQSASQLETSAQSTESEKDSVNDFISIPVLPNGNLDIFQIRVQYGIEKEDNESFKEYRERKHINAYLASRNVIEDTPTIWKFINFLVPGLTASLYNNWSSKFAQHKLPFPDWFDVYGRYTLVTTGKKQQNINSLMNKVKAEVMQEASDYIQSTAEPMKNRLVQIFGTWSYGLGSEFFCSFREYAASDVRLKQIEDAYTTSDSNDSDDESINSNDSNKENVPPISFKPQVKADGANYIPPSEWEVGTTLDDINEWATPITNQTKRYAESVALSDEQFHAIQLDRFTFPGKYDFLPGGKYAHIYIPSYVHVPGMILEDLFGKRFVSHGEKLIMWNRLKEAKKQAAEVLEQHKDPWKSAPNGCENPNPTLDTPWLRYLRQNDSQSGWTKNIDIVQHIYAHQWYKTHTESDDYTYRNDLYDIMIRPIERLFGVDMKLSRALLIATHDCEKQSWLKRKIMTMIDIKYQPFLKTNYCLTNLSEIRNISGIMLSKAFLTNIPPLAVSPMMRFARDTFRYSEDATWKIVGPTAKDFYPDGKLHGFFVHPSTPLPSWVIKKFYKGLITDHDEERLCTEIVLARAEWAREVQKQLVLQCGPKSFKYPLTNRLPDWAYHAYDMPYSTLQKVKSILPVGASQIGEMDLTPHHKVIEQYMNNNPATSTNIPPDLARHLGVVPMDKEAWNMFAHKLNQSRGMPNPEETLHFSHKEKRYIIRMLKNIQESSERLTTGPLTAKSERHLEEIEKEIYGLTKLLQKGSKSDLSCPVIGLSDLQVKRDSSNKVEDVFSTDVLLSRHMRDVIIIGLNILEETAPVDRKQTQEKSQIYDDHIKEMLQASLPCPTYAQMLVKPRKVGQPGRPDRPNPAKPQPTMRMITKSASDKQIAKSRGNAIRALSPPITVPEGYVPKYYPKPGDPEFNPMIYKKKHHLTTSERDELLQIKASNKEKVKRKLTFFRDQDPDRQYRNRNSSSRPNQSQQAITPSNDATSVRRKRGDILEGTIVEDSFLSQSLPQVENDSPPTYLQNYADRMRRVETRPFQSPPRPFRQREHEERPPTPPISPPPNPPPSNVYMWNGSRTFIPEWAKVPKSAWQVGRDPLLQVPIEQAPRLQMAHALRRVPMDGVNRHEDIIIRESNYEGENTILIQATTKVRGVSPSQSDFRSLQVPMKVVPCLLHMLDNVERAVMPPAEQDFNLENSSLFMTNEIIGRYNYIVEIKSITEMQGDERLVRIYREDKDGQDQGGIAFPWMFTTLFNAKIRNVFKEINGNPNNSTTSIQSPQQ